MFMIFGQPAGGSAANGLAGEDDFRRGDFFAIDEELIGEGEGVLATLFTGLARAVAVARVVVGKDSEAHFVEAIHGKLYRGEVFGITVGPEQGGHIFICGTVIGGNVLAVLVRNAGEVFLLV